MKCCLSFVKNKSNQSHICSAICYLEAVSPPLLSVSLFPSCHLSALFPLAQFISLFTHSGPMSEHTWIPRDSYLCIQIHTHTTHSHLTPHSHCACVHAAKLQDFVHLLLCHMGHVIILHIDSSSTNPISTLHHSNC